MPTRSAPLRAVALRIAAAAVAAALSGCFAYVGSDLETLPDGQEVQVLLSRDAAIRLSDEGAGELVSIDDPVLSGALRRASDGRIGVLVPLRSGSIDSPGRPIAQELLLDRKDVLRVARRRLDRPRSALTAVGTAGLGTALVVLIVGGSNGQIERPDGGNTSDLRLPLDLAGRD